MSRIIMSNEVDTGACLLLERLEMLMIEHSADSDRALGTPTNDPERKMSAGVRMGGPRGRRQEGGAACVSSRCPALSVYPRTITGS